MSTVRVYVTTAAQAAARDAAAIAAGVPSGALMEHAGTAAVDAIRRHAAGRLHRGVAVYAGTGNNGGDGWVVARVLREHGAPVTVHATGAPSTDDARAARAAALAGGPFAEPTGNEAVVVDGLLGTGSTGPLRGAVASEVARVGHARASGAYIAALDVPSGLDASTGGFASGAVPADLTVTFGTLKRGLTVARGSAGLVEVADIGLGVHADLDDGAPVLLDREIARAPIPRIEAGAHKGTRGRIAIVGGNRGMAGAAVLAARGALRAGAGLVRLVVAPASLEPVQAALSEATASIWPTNADELASTLGDADAIVAGPGLGAEERALLALVLRNTTQPIVLDADALNAFAGDVDELGRALAGRAAVLTPHPAECGRLLGMSTADVLASRFDVGALLAAATGAVVVLKGTPTVISAPGSPPRVIVAPVGSPVLATGGSGDVLAGVACALLAVMSDPCAAAQAAVWAHGTAAERVGTAYVRGATLADVLDELRTVWHERAAPLPPGVLAMLPAVGER